MHIYASCGLWKFDPLKGWGFAVDKNKRGRVLYMELTSSFEDLRRMVLEDFGIDQNLVELELSYLPMELIGSIDCPPVIIESDRQVKKFLTNVREKLLQGCVCLLHLSGETTATLGLIMRNLTRLSESKMNLPRFHLEMTVLVHLNQARMLKIILTQTAMKKMMFSP